MDDKVDQEIQMVIDACKGVEFTIGEDDCIRAEKYGKRLCPIAIFLGADRNLGLWPEAIKKGLSVESCDAIVGGADNSPRFPEIRQRLIRELGIKVGV